jgi:hypothetical protein
LELRPIIPTQQPDLENPPLTMNPETKIILEELNKRFDENWRQR